jgi:hypothetical protein
MDHRKLARLAIPMSSDRDMGVLKFKDNEPHQNGV